MGTIRNFLRKQNKKSNQNIRKDLKTKDKELITEKYYEILDKHMKDGSLNKDPKILWQLVNKEWNIWIKEQLAALKHSPVEYNIFKSVLEASVLLINKEFQERREQLLEKENLEKKSN